MSIANVYVARSAPALASEIRFHCSVSVSN
jgi:hypothetical protein